MIALTINQQDIQQWYTFRPIQLVFILFHFQKWYEGFHCQKWYVEIILIFGAPAILVSQDLDTD